MPRWEYHVVTLNTEYETTPDALLRSAMGEPENPTKSSDIIAASLRIWGKMGWELAAVVPAMPSASSLQDISTPNPWVYHLIFKRPAG